MTTVALMLLLAAGAPDVRQIAASGRLCWFRQLRTWAEHEIAKERALSRRSGVVNVTKLGSLHLDLEEAQDGDRRAKKMLAGRKPLSCRLPRVEVVRWCLHLEANGGVDEHGVVHSGECTQPESVLAASDE